jgi:hypothetical protein
MKKIILLQLLLFSAFAFAQVGINTTTPEAQLDIKSSNQALPSNKDGLLIPKIDAFPLINPTIDQQGMMVYLTTFAGLSSRGFYFWDHFATSWKPLGGNYSGWGLNGNSGIDAPTDFIGTTDNVDVVFKRFGTTSGVLGASNTSFGYFSLPANTTGTSNTAIGGFTLRNNTTGSRNTAIGDRALRDNTTGNDNTASGIGALRSNTSGNNNTAIGQTALAGNTTGVDNTATGYFTLFFNTTGINNTANGSYALSNNTTGDSNTAVGLASLSNNTTGNHNTATGLSALSLNTTGIENTANGSVALLLNSTGNYNSAFGRLAMITNTTGSENSSFGTFSDVASVNLLNATAIGARAVVGASNSLVLGSINGVKGATSGVNVGIGTTTPLDKLHVVGNIRMVDGNQAAGKVLISDANGTASWQPNSATNAWGLAGNTATTPATNFIGTTDNQSLAFRTNNIERMSILNTGNVGIGITNPSRNLQVTANSASTTNGQLYIQQSGAGDALMHIGNTGGRHYNLGLDTSENSFKIGTSATIATAVTGSTLMTLLPTGELGVGTTTPDRKLEISAAGAHYARITNIGSAEVGIEFKRTGGGSDWQVRNDSGDLIFGQSNDDLVTVADVVRVGGSSFTPVTDNFVQLGQTARRWTVVFATNGVIQTSDANDKKDMQPLTYGLEKIKNLRPISFQWKNDNIDKSSTHLGFIAQEVQHVLPEIVVNHEWKEIPNSPERVWEKTDKLGMKYTEIIPVLVKAIQEQQTQIEELKAKIEKLENK